MLGLDTDRTEVFANHPPKELTSCHLKPAHCFYSIQMFSSILSLPLPPFLPPSPPLPTFSVCVWMARHRKKWTLMKCALSLIITFRFFFAVFSFLRCQNVLTYQLCSTSYSPSPPRHRLTTLYVMLLEGLPGTAHPSFMWVLFL